jgi:hypothetical protein
LGNPAIKMRRFCSCARKSLRFAGDNRGAQLEVGRGKTRQVFILLHIAPDYERDANRQVSLAIQAGKSMRATTNGASTGIWLATAAVPDFPALTGDTQTDVCVIGAGIAGLTSAYLLCRVLFGQKKLNVCVD